MGVIFSWKKISYLLVIDTICITDFLILFDISILRQIFGFFLLTLLAGLLILHIMNINDIDKLDRILLSIGLSISFLMIFGLIVNFIGLLFRFQEPLGELPFLIALNFALSIFLLAGYITNNNPLFLKPRFILVNKEKILLIFPILLPVLSIIGIELVNQIDSSIFITGVLISIIVFIVLIFISHVDIPKRIYSIIIFSISVSLLLLLSLRTDHLIGADTHIEYYFFQLISSNLHWFMQGNDLVNLCLSVTILPTLYHSILNVPNEFLFKVLYCLLYSISPLIIFSFTRKYIGDLYSFLASLFFMFQMNFLWTAANARTSIAILFVSLSILVLFGLALNKRNTTILLMAFITSMIFSHYTTSYIFFFLLLSAFIICSLLKVKTISALNFKIIAFFFVMIFFWYSIVSTVAFESGTFLLQKTLGFQNLFIEDAKDINALEIIGYGIGSKNIIQQIEFASNWLIFILIGVGFIAYIIFFFDKKHKSKQNNLIGIFLKNLKYEYLIIAAICILILFMMVILPFISLGYDIQRVFALTSIILAIFFIFGGIQTTSFINKLIKSPQIPVYAILIIILSLNFFCVTGVFYEYFGDSRAIILNSDGPQSYNFQVYDRDVESVLWLNNYMPLKSLVYTNQLGSRIFSSRYGRNDYIKKYIADYSPQHYYVFIRTGTNINGGILNGYPFLIKYEKILDSGGGQVYQ